MRRFEHGLTGALAWLLGRPVLAGCVLLALVAAIVVTGAHTPPPRPAAGPAAGGAAAPERLARAGRAAGESVLRVEAEHLAALRALQAIPGMADAILAADVATIERLAAPVAPGLELIDVLDARGVLLYARRPADAARRALVDQSAGAWPVARRSLDGDADGLGDRWAALTRATWGHALYVSGAVRSDGRVVGAVLTGTLLDTLTERLAKETGADVTVYGADGLPLAGSPRGTAPPTALAPHLATDLTTTVATVAAVATAAPGSAGGAFRDVGARRELVQVLQIRQQPAAMLGLVLPISRD